MKYILYGTLFSVIACTLVFLYQGEEQKDWNQKYYYYLIENEYHVKSVARSTSVQYVRGDEVLIDQYSMIVDQPRKYTFTQKAKILRWISMPTY